MSVQLTHTDAALRVCVDFAENGRISGTVYSRRLTVPMPFTDIGTLLLNMEAVLDRQNYPQAFQRTRTFSKAPRPADAHAADDLNEGMSSEEVEAASGAVCTFMIFVVSRRNTTWQGKVDWLDAAVPSEAFSSVLELIKLTDRHIFKLS